MHKNFLWYNVSRGWQSMGEYLPVSPVLATAVLEEEKTSQSWRATEHTQ